MKLFSTLFGFKKNFGIVLLFVIALFLANKAKAAEKHFIGTGTAAPWTTTSNWSSTKGGGSCSCTPAAGDDIYFDSGTSVTITLVPSLVVHSLTVNSNTNAALSGTTGALTLSINGGSYTNNLLINSGSTLQITSAGTSLTLNFATTANQFGQIDGTLQVNALGIFNTKSISTIVTVGSTGKIINNRTGTGPVTSSITTLFFSSGSTYSDIFAGTVTIPTATWDANSNISFDTGSNNTKTFPTVNSTTSPSSTIIYGNININSSGQTVTISGSATVNNFTLTAGSFIAPTTFTINGAMNLTSGAGTYTTGTTTNIKGNWTKSGGTFTPGTGTVVFMGTAAQSIGGSNTTAFYKLTINAGATVTINNSGSSCANNLSVSGILQYPDQASAITFTVGGTATVAAGGIIRSNPNPTVTGTHYLAIVSTYTQIGTGNYVNVSSNGLYTSTVFKTGDFRSKTGTLNWNVVANWDILSTAAAWGTSGTYYPGAASSPSYSTVLIQDGSTITMNVTPSKSNSNLIIGTSTSGSLSIGAFALTIANNIAIAANGTLNSSGAGTLNIAGHFMNAGTVSCSSGTVVFNGTSNQNLGGSAAMTFNTVTINDGATVTLGKNVTCATLNIGAGTSGILQYYDNATAISLTVTSALTVSANAILRANPTPTVTGTHFLGIGGTYTQTGIGNYVNVSTNGLYTSTINKTGDYRSHTGSLNWNTAANWDILGTTSGSWISPPANYPGGAANTANVYIVDGSIMTLSSSPANSISSLIIGTGGAGATVSMGAYTATVANSVAIAANSSLIYSGAGALNVGGNFSNFGTFTCSTSTTTFNGAAQNLSGTGTTTFNTITINNGSTVTLGTNLYCASLTVGNGASGILQYYDNATPITLTVSGALTVNTGAIIRSNPTPTVNGTHYLFMGSYTITGTANYVNVNGAFTSTIIKSGDFYSHATGNWNTNASWDILSATGTIIASPTYYPGQTGSIANANVFIQNGHTITLNVSPALAIGNLTINSGGVLQYQNSTSVTLLVNANVTINSGGTLSSYPIPTVTAMHFLGFGGTYTQNGTANVINGSGSFISSVFKTGDLRSNAASISALNWPTTTTYWQALSTTATWGATATYPGNTGNSVYSSLWIQSGHSASYDGGQVVNIANILVNGTLAISTFNLYVTNTIAIASSATLSGTNGWLFVGGNFLNSGTFTYSTSNIYFTGTGSTGTQTIGGSTATTFYNVNIYNGSNVRLGQNITCTTGGLFDNNGTLDCGTYTMSGGGTFTLEPNAALKTANTNGISALGTATGSILVTTA